VPRAAVLPAPVPASRRSIRSLATLLLILAVLAGQLAMAASTAAAATAMLLQTVQTSAWSPGSPDPSGLDYLPAPHNRLVVSDGEVDETTGAGFHGVNIWFADLADPHASPTRTMNTTVSSPKNLEPVGLAFDDVAGELYISRDGSSSRVWVYRAGGDGAFGTADDVLARWFSISDRGVVDGEGLAFGDGRLWVADGSAREVWWFGAGGDGIVGTSDDTSGHWDTAVLGQVDPEGIDYDASSGTLWMISKSRTSPLAEVTTAGALVRTVPIGFLNPQNPSAVAIAPSSTGSGMSIWIADRGTDNGSDPSENDGRLYEIAVTDGPPPGGNLLVNGGFESADGSGRPTGWSLDSRFTRVVGVAQGGTYAGRHQATDEAGYKIRQDVVVTGGTAYTLAGFVNVPPTPDAFKLVIKVQWRAGGALGTVTGPRFAKATKGYQSWSLDLTAPAGATTARVLMVVTGLSTTVYVDELTFTAR
jgi:hypothetical protein